MWLCIDISLTDTEALTEYQLKICACMCASTIPLPFTSSSSHHLILSQSPLPALYTLPLAISVATYQGGWAYWSTLSSQYYPSRPWQIGYDLGGLVFAMPRKSNCLRNCTLGKGRAVWPKCFLLPAFRLHWQLLSQRLSVLYTFSHPPSPKCLEGRFMEEWPAEGRVGSRWSSGAGQRSSARGWGETDRWGN